MTPLCKPQISFYFYFFYRLLESDTKSLNSLSGTSTGHSRRNSDTSQISVTSGTSHPSSLTAGVDDSGDGAVSSDNDETVWPLWGKIVNDWENFKKKQSAQLKVSNCCIDEDY